MPQPIQPIHPDSIAAQFLLGFRTAILLHTLPDGSSHFDWLFESVRHDADALAASAVHADARTLICLRTPTRPDHLSPGEHMPVKRIADHRQRYLDYQGPLSGDRGTVQRVADGRIVGIRQSSDQQPMHIQVQWTSVPLFAPNPCWFTLSMTQDANMWQAMCIGERPIASDPMPD